jgi:hypothetical protein
VSFFFFRLFLVLHAQRVSSISHCTTGLDRNCTSRACAHHQPAKTLS